MHPAPSHTPPHPPLLPPAILHPPPTPAPGAGAALTITTGSCKLVRVANPLQLDFVLSCTEPSLSVETTAPRYNSRFVSAAEAATEVSVAGVGCVFRA
jgi:hypothetical protein